MSCNDDIVPDYCDGEMKIPVSSAIIADKNDSICYTWICPDDPPKYPRIHSYCREDKQTGQISCAIRESGGQFACPGKKEGGYIVNAYDPNTDHRLTNAEANGTFNEPCPNLEPEKPPGDQSKGKSSPPSHPSPVNTHEKEHHHSTAHAHRPHHEHVRVPVKMPPELSCLDCKPVGQGWTCGSCK